MFCLVISTRVAFSERDLGRHRVEGVFEANALREGHFLVRKK